MRGKRQVQAAKQKTATAKEELSEGQLPGKGVHNLRQRRYAVSSVEKIESDAAWSDAPAKPKRITTSKKVRGRNRGRSGKILVGFKRVNYEGSGLNVGNTMESRALVIMFVRWAGSQVYLVMGQAFPDSTFC